MKKVKYKRKKNVDLLKYNIKFNEENNWITNVDDKYIDKVLLNPDFVLVDIKEKPEDKNETKNKKIKKGDK